MGEVEIVGSVMIGRRKLPLKKSPLVMREIGELFITATATQMRILAYGAKDYLIDKLMAHKPPVGSLRVKQLKTTYSDPPDDPKLQKKKEADVVVAKRTLPIPPRDSDPATVTRVPFKMVPLTKEWQRRKISKNLDPRLLIGSGDYIRGIVVRKRYDPNKGGVSYIVTTANREHKSSPIRLQTLALIHEFGTKAYTVPLFGNPDRLVKIKLPPRPHWRPTYRNLVKQFNSIGEEANARMLRMALQHLA